MRRKNKIMIAAAVCAVVILIGSSVVRVAVNRAADDAQDAGDTQTAITQSQDTQSGDTDSGDTTASEGTDTTATDLLTSHAWQVQGDASRQVSFRDGYFVETGGVNSRMAAYTVSSVTTSGTQKVLAAEVTTDAGTTSTAIIIDGAEGGYTVTSDAFALSKAYVQGAASEDAITLTGIDDTYLGLVGDDETGLKSALVVYCRNHVPTAHAVSFDGEVYLETRTGSVSATFHCDDAASTILSVTYAAGTFTVAG